MGSSPGLYWRHQGVCQGKCSLLRVADHSKETWGIFWELSGFRHRGHRVWSCFHNLIDDSCLHWFWMELLKDLFNFEFQTNSLFSLLFYWHLYFSQCREEKVPILVKLLPSIDRSKGLEMAQQVTDLAIHYSHTRPDIIVGLDVSGNMMTSKIDDFFPLLLRARNSGLKLA